MFRDLKAVSKLVRLGLHVKRAERQNLTVPKVFQRYKNLISYDIIWLPKVFQRYKYLISYDNLTVPRSFRYQNIMMYVMVRVF